MQLESGIPIISVQTEKNWYFSFTSARFRTLALIGLRNRGRNSFGQSNESGKSPEADPDANRPRIARSDTNWRRPPRRRASMRSLLQRPYHTRHESLHCGPSVVPSRAARQDHRGPIVCEQSPTRRKARE